MIDLYVIPSNHELKTRGEKLFLEQIKACYKKLNQDGKVIIYIMPKFSGLVPDFIIVDSIRGVSIVEVKDWYPENITEANNRFFTVNGKILDNPFFKVGTYRNVLIDLLKLDGRLLTNNYELKIPINYCLVLTNFRREDLARFEVELRSSEGRILTQENLKLKWRENDFLNFLFKDAKNLEDYEISIIRKIISPEILIEDSYNESKTELEKIRETIKVLDAKQEEFAKKIPMGHYLIRGVAGCGKTVILLNRAIFLAKENRDWRILIITYNRTLKHRLKERLDYLLSKISYPINAENIEITTFHKICFQLAGSEINREKNNYIGREDEFYDKVYPRLALRHAFPKYDAILVDEVQDFDKEWFPLVLRLTRKIEGKYNILLVGDETQRIYRREWSWRSVGLDMRGRSYILKKSYRTAKLHLALALKFLSKDQKLVNKLSEIIREDEVEEDYHSLEKLEGRNKNGQVILLEGDISLINDFIKDRINEGYEFGDFLILTRTWRSALKIYSYLDRDLRENARKPGDKELIIFDRIVITTFHSSKGLENKICIVANLDQCPLLDQEEIELEIERKLVYVAMTRASEILVLHSFNFETGFSKAIKEIAKDLNLI